MDRDGELPMRVGAEHRSVEMDPRRKREVP
jgi:hypothetical protein